jgi:hypothetical protein
MWQLAPASAAAAPCTAPARASVRCWTGFQPSFGFCASPGPNAPAAVATRSSKRQHRSGRSPGGPPTPALLNQVFVSKYCDHTPLYRQSQIFACHGIDLERSTLAGWVGGACWWLEALHDRLRKNVPAAGHLFVDDTPVPVLDPGRGRTKAKRLWVYAREQRGWGGADLPAAVFIFAPDRKPHMTKRPSMAIASPRVDPKRRFEHLGIDFDDLIHHRPSGPPREVNHRFQSAPRDEG